MIKTPKNSIFTQSIQQFLVIKGTFLSFNLAAQQLLHFFLSSIIDISTQQMFYFYLFKKYLQYTFGIGKTAVSPAQTYLASLQKEMFKQGMIRNIIGAASSFAFHSCLAPPFNICMLAGVGALHACSLIATRKKLKDATQFATTDQSKIDQNQKDQPKIEAKQQPEKLAGTNLSFHNWSQVVCTGLLQGLFIGGMGFDFWQTQQSSLLGISLTISINTIINCKLFQYLYASSSNPPGKLTTHMLGSVLPVFVFFLQPVGFNNGFLQSNLIKRVKKGFQENPNFNQNPQEFLINRTGIRLYGIVGFYALTLIQMISCIIYKDEFSINKKPSHETEKVFAQS